MRARARFTTKFVDFSLRLLYLGVFRRLRLCRQMSHSLNHWHKFRTYLKFGSVVSRLCAQLERHCFLCVSVSFTFFSYSPRFRRQLFAFPRILFFYLLTINSNTIDNVYFVSISKANTRTHTHTNFTVTVTRGILLFFLFASPMFKSFSTKLFAYCYWLEQKERRKLLFANC